MPIGFGSRFGVLWLERLGALSADERDAVRFAQGSAAPFALQLVTCLTLTAAAQVCRAAPWLLSRSGFLHFISDYAELCRHTAAPRHPPSYLAPGPVKRRITRTLDTMETPQPKGVTMPKFVIERHIPKIGAVSAGELRAISQKSCGVLQDLGPEEQWVHSYMTGDKIYCVYNAANEGLVREHARRGGFPADSVARVVTTIDPTTAEA